VQGPLAQAAQQVGDCGAGEAQRLQLDNLVAFQRPQAFHRQLGGVFQPHVPGKFFFIIFKKNCGIHGPYRQCFGSDSLSLDPAFKLNAFKLNTDSDPEF
jgi:hypothetical protein